MSELISLPAPGPEFNEVLVQTVAQNAAHTQAVAEQLMSLSGATAKALKTSQQAISLVTGLKDEMEELRGQVGDIDRKLRERVTIDDNQEGTLYQAVHDRAAWAVKYFPDETFQTHIVRIWNKIKRDFVISRYRRLLAKDYDQAMRIALSYPGFGRNWPVK